jgi:hypothetical protein
VAAAFAVTSADAAKKKADATPAKQKDAAYEWNTKNMGGGAAGGEKKAAKHAKHAKHAKKSGKKKKS